MPPRLHPSIQRPCPASPKPGCPVTRVVQRPPTPPPAHPAQAAYGSAAEGLESAHAALLRAIRERYAAETLWSDKIRRASTWWTAGLMALHLASFMVGGTGREKRNRERWFAPIPAETRRGGGLLDGNSLSSSRTCQTCALRLHVSTHPAM